MSAEKNAQFYSDVRWIVEQVLSEREGGSSASPHPPRMAVDVQRLVGLLLDQPWHGECEVIPDYMPPNPRPDTRPRVVVRHNNGTEHPAFLRHSCGPKQGFFWDIYGDDMQETELAILALSKAPYPRSVAPLTFKLPLKPNA